VDEQFSPVDGDDARVSLQGPVDLLRTDRGILATGELSSSAAGECDRCLRPANYPVVLPIEEEFLPTVDAVTGGTLPSPDEPEASMIDQHHILDLNDVARQMWLVQLPMQVLCREDCAGLCPECGADRNARGCVCELGPIDSRWAALARLQSLNAGQFEEN